MSITNQNLVFKAVWLHTRRLCNPGSEQANLPNDDELENSPLYRCADRRPILFSYCSDVQKKRLYTEDPVALPSQSFDSFPSQRATRSLSCNNVDELIELMECLLSFHAFYKYNDCMLGESMLAQAKHRILDMLAHMSGMVNRGEGTMNWCISKFHDLTHMATDMKCFGATVNYDASKGESGLKTWTKLPARTSQASRGGDQFLRQLATRLQQQTLLERADGAFQPNIQSTYNCNTSLEYPKYHINRNASAYWEPHKKISQR